jgi:hypothetical protein
MRHWKCVRCGRNDRAEGTFLCAECLADPARRKEQVHAEKAGHGDYREARRILIDRHNWAGEWPKYTEARA